MTPRLFLVAGEASGDIYGADLVEALRRARPDVELLAVGGPRMAAAGARVLWDSTEWGLIGWLAAVPRIPLFLVRLWRVEQAIADLVPKAVVLIDFPGFNLVLAERRHKRVPLAYFIPPMVSTRKGDRARRIARLGMRLLAVFPFEAEAYRAAGADVAFVGHPAVDRVRPTAPREIIRRRLGIPSDALLLAVLPGSRRQELHRHLPILLPALALLRARFPQVRAVLPLAAQRHRTLVERAARGASVPVTLVAGGGQEGYDVMAAADFAIITSGTATLEALCLGLPAAVIYKLSPLDFWLARRIASVSWIGLPSLLAGRLLMPELVQDVLTAERVAAEAAAWLADPERRTRCRQDLLALRERLGAPGVADRAAQEILRHARLLAPEPSSTIQTT